MTTTEVPSPAQTDKKLSTRETRIVVDSGPLANLFDTARFEHMGRIAAVMAGASLIPDHMWKDKSGALQPEMVKANCFLVVNQAVRWGMDPFAVVPETYVVGGKLGFQGKLVAAVINARAPIKAPLNYSFSGVKGKDDYTVTVSATIEGETDPRTITLSVGEAKTDNKMWSRDPEQKLVYSGATKWARRHCPEIILGVLTDDDADFMQHGLDGAKQVNEPVKPAFKSRGKPEPETLSAETTVVSTASEILPHEKAAGGSQESSDKATSAESVKPATSPAQPLPSDGGAKHEVTTKPADEARTSATTTESRPSAASEDESQDPCAPLLKKIREAMKSYDIPEEGVIKWAKEQAILPKRSSLSLDELSDNILGLIVNALPNLIKPYAEGPK